MVATSNWALGQLTSVAIQDLCIEGALHTLVTTITVFTKHITTFWISLFFWAPYICFGPLINEHPVSFQLNFNKAFPSLV